MSASAIEKHPLAGKTILISGAGIAGLAFARGLAEFWPSLRPSHPLPKIRIYERDPRQLPSARGNYSLGLRSDALSGGLQALRTLGLLDQIIAAGVPNSSKESKGATVRDENWEPLFGMPKADTPPDGLPIASMRITRHSIREVMIRALEERNVEMFWEAQCVDAKRVEEKDGRKGMQVVVRHGEGAREEEVYCDLLIVADGASSKLREALRPNDGLDFTGAVLTAGNAYFEPGKVPPQVAEKFGPVIGGQGNSLVLFPIDDRGAVWFVTRRSKTPTTPVSGENAYEMRDEIFADVRQRTALFGEKFEELLQATDPKSLKIFNAQDRKPITHTDIERDPVVYIGDASHAVSPYAGNGLNMALMDGVSLSKLFCEQPSIPEAVARFDAESVPRCSKTLKISHVVCRLIHAQGILWWLIKKIAAFARWWTKGKSDQ